MLINAIDIGYYEAKSSFYNARFNVGRKPYFKFPESL